MQNLPSSQSLLDLQSVSPVGSRPLVDSASSLDHAGLPRSQNALHRPSSQLVFIDPTVQNYQSLAAGVSSGAEVFVLDGSLDGVQQISDILGTRRDITGVHIISHASAGDLRLGGTSLSLDNLGSYRSPLQRWSAALSADADVLLYGCDAAAGDRGAQFLQQLSNITGADVAASTDITGAAALGGNWTLEAKTGAIETDLVINADTRDRYADTLANPVINYTNFASTTGLQLNGDADESGNVLRLTPAQTSKAGSAFYTTGFDLDTSTSFSTRFQFRLGGGNGTNGADGITFMLQNSTAGINALGAGGGSLGYDGGTGLNRSLAVEFDTYQNSGDTGDNQVSLLRDGNAFAALAAVNAPIDLNNGNAINAWIDYNAATDQLDVYLAQSTTKPTTALLSSTIDLVSVVGNRAFVGFSGATGGLVNHQDIENWQFSTSVPTQGGTGDGLTAQYYDNRDFTNLKVTRIDPRVNFNWNGGSPDPSIAPDTFSARWSGQVQAVSTGQYTFYTNSDDGIRLFVNGQPIINNFTDHAPTENSGTIDLVAGQKYDIRLEYYENAGGAVSTLSWSGPGVAKQIIPQSQLYSAQIPSPGTGNGLKGEYYDNIDFTNLKFDRTDATLNFDFGTGSPDSRIAPDTYSVRWTGQVQPLYSENYTFYTNSDDGIRLTVNGQQIINNFTDHAPTEDRGTIALVAGQKYDITVDYYERGGGSVAQLGWQSARQFRQIIPQSQLYSAPPIGNPGVLALGQDAITVNENSGTATIRVDRLNGSDGETSVTYTTRGGTAIGGSDFTVTAGTLSFASGETSKTVTIPILDDNLPESTEQFGFGILSVVSGNAVLGVSRTATITILDNDAPASYAFSANDFKVDENAGTATVTVQRGGNTAIPGSVAYATSNGTAIAGSDYTATSGTVSFAAGETVKQFTVAITDDALGERNETLTLTLSNPVNGVLGAIATSTMTIADNDPGSFRREAVVAGLTDPTAFDWTPDGQYLFISQKNGVIRVARNGVLQQDLALDISPQVNGIRDRGALGIAVHPQFFNGSPYVYVLYTYDPPQVNQFSGLAGPDGKGNRTARLGRFTANLDANGVVKLDKASEEIILGKNSKWEFISRPDGNSTDDFTIAESGKNVDGTYIQDFLIADSESHSIGTVKFGTDGFLYVSNGDGASYNAVDARAVRTLSLDNLSGKILRINPLTGAAPTDNPFYDGNSNSNRSKVWDLGLRNPFRFTINKDNGQVYIGDVGWGAYEEVNTGRGKNFGWPGFEGGNGTNLQTFNYSGLPAIQAFYASNPTVTAPIYSYQHYSAGNPGNAIVMGDFYTGNTFPSIYDKRLFITDASKGTVDSLIFDANGAVIGEQRFASNLPGIVQITTGPDGNLYYARLDLGLSAPGEIGRWRPDASAAVNGNPQLPKQTASNNASPEASRMDVSDPFLFQQSQGPKTNGK